MHYAKAGPDDILMTVEVTNAGPDQAELHVLPTAWFRNTWSWDNTGTVTPELAAGRRDRRGGRRSRSTTRSAGDMELLAAPGPDGAAPTALFCENETNVARLFGAAPITPFPKDGINDHVVSAARRRSTRSSAAPSARSGTS